MNQTEEIFPLPKSVITDGGTDKCFLMKIEGTPLDGAPIEDGDWVIVQEDADVRQGDVVAAWANGDGRLQWADGQDGVIGKVVSVLHRMP